MIDSVTMKSAKHSPATSTSSATPSEMAAMRAEGLAAGATAIYIGAIALVSVITGLNYVLFPELGALSHDILQRPRGTWARAPLMLVITPVLAALIGTIITRHLNYGVLSVVLTVGLVLIVLKVLRSPIAPAISAGLLPLTLGVPNFWYPPSILIGTTLLAAIAYLRARRLPRTMVPPTVADTAQDAVERLPQRLSWAPYFLIFLLLAATAATETHQHFVLFPPLVVIAYEMFAHPEICPWAERPWSLPLACVASAAAGTALASWHGVLMPFAAMASVLISIAVLRIMRLHVPPALAVGLLPFVMPDAGWSFPLVVGAGTLLLSLSFLTWRRLGARDLGRA